MVGFYDRRCMLTGLSLYGIDATLVPLLRLPDGYRPVALGIAGTYDRYGAIDGIDEDANTALVRSYFLRRLGDGGFVVEDPQPLEDIQDRAYFDEAMRDYADVPAVRAALDGYARDELPAWLDD